MSDPWASFRSVATGPADPWAGFRSAAQQELDQRKLSGMDEAQLRAAAYVQPAPPPGVTIHGADGDVYVDDKGKPQKATPAETEARFFRERDGKAGDVGDSILRGLPFLGEFLPRARAAYQGGDYAKNLEREQARAKTFDDDNPIASMAGKVTGGIAGTVAAYPVMKTAGPVGAAARIMFGGGASSPVGSIGRGTVAGLLQGAAQGAGRSTDLTNANEVTGNVMKDGAFGGLLGGAIPGVVSGGVALKNSLLNPSKDALSNVPKEGARFLQQEFGDPASLNAVRQRMRDIGPNAVMADASEDMLGLARGAAANPGTRSTVVDGLLARDAGKNARINSSVNAELGPAPIPSRVDASIREGQDALGPAYGDVMSRAGAVNTQGLADDLSASAINLRGPAQTRVNQVRGMLDIPTAPGNLDPNPSALFQTRQAIDGLLATEQNPQVIRQLTMARQRVDAELATAAPGIKDVDANFAELARQREGLQRGGQVFDAGKTAIRPQELADEVTQAANPQGLLVGPSAVPMRMQQGARAEIDRIVGTNANDVAKLNQVLKNEGDWNRDKLRTLFGQDKADRLLSVLENERVMEGTTRRVAFGSDTAMATKFAEFIKGIGEPTPIPTNTTFWGNVEGAGRKAIQAARRGSGAGNSQEVADALARVSVAQGREADQIIQSLMSRSARARNDGAAYRASGLLAAPSSPALDMITADQAKRRRSRQ